MAGYLLIRNFLIKGYHQKTEKINKTLNNNNKK